MSSRLNPNRLPFRISFSRARSRRVNSRFVPRREFRPRMRLEVIAGYAFHLGLFALLFFAAPHVHFIEERLLGFGWTPMPHWAFIVAALTADGIDSTVATFAAQASGGSLERARLLVEDEAAADRWAAWAELPERLDGSGAQAAAQVDHLLALIEEASGPLEERHAAERAAMEERAERFGERGLGRARFDERHKRELRRQPERTV